MISDSDTESAPFVAAVNEAFVHKYLARQNALGRELDLGGKDTGNVEAVPHRGRPVGSGGRSRRRCCQSLCF